jgi:hypothetical protein
MLVNVETRVCSDVGTRVLYGMYTDGVVVSSMSPTPECRISVPFSFKYTPELSLQHAVLSLPQQKLPSLQRETWVYPD